MEEIFLYWGGDERGSCFSEPTAVEDFPVCIPIATQALHACGVASAFKLRAQHRVCVVTCGDGATSKGDFLEALNVAGVWRLPVVFVINNNQWAISVPRQRQCAAHALADKAIGAGLYGETVDGNDIFAVYESFRAALDRARKGEGATLLECISYRLGDHTTSDDATRYRDADQIRQAWSMEPVARLRAYMESLGGWDELREQALINECQCEVDGAVLRFDAVREQDPESILDYVYARWPKPLATQRSELLERISRRAQGGDNDA